ncbi:MAG: glycoside hydrolase family 127 protein [Planctomycetes bacterium]|nr:glycoside hydrolase family 127 protein [Planctomycetota bacterium]
MLYRKQLFTVIFAAAVISNLCIVSCYAQDNKVELRHDYNVKPVPFNRVLVNDDFWTPRLQTNRKVTIPYAFMKCEETGRIRNFEKAAGLMKGKHEGIYFNDSDVYKIMEGAAYSLRVYPETMMRLYLDKVIKIMDAAQWEDGYLFTFYSVPERQSEKLWTNVQSIHEQYCVGHMYEAAVAHYQVTGEKSFLNIAMQNADLICDTFNPNNRTDPPGHQEIEIGLCKLYRATGDEKYLNQAKFFLDQRGRIGKRGPKGDGGLYGQYSQDHKPVTEQTKALGHSVRAAYLYTGMADVAALTGNMAYVEAIDAIWKDVVETKLYITGGIGAAGGNEGFGSSYELPNMTAYCETCASIANILWNHRMFLMHNDARYIDVLERVLYNAALSGISMKGDLFFYPNPLQSLGQHARSPWFGCACCPSNVARFIPSVPGYTYAYKNNNVYVNLFISGESTIETINNKVKLIQQTRYPWDGIVSISVEPEKSGTFGIYIRIPGWARNKPVPGNLYKFQKTVNEEVTLKVNGERAVCNTQKGFACIKRKWQRGDTIELNLPMPVRRVIAHPNIEADKDKIALQRGPIVFCLEWPDNDGKVLNLMINDNAMLRSEYRPELLNGVVVVTGNAQVVKRTKNGNIAPSQNKRFIAIPYYAWAHRGRGQMAVWTARKPEVARPEPADTLTYRSKTTASFVHASLDAIKDQILPENSSDSSGLQLDFWPHKGTTEWIKFNWKQKHEISRVKIYWFDDTGRGQCSVPKSWKVFYSDNKGNFKPVKNSNSYLTEKDTFNEVIFEPVKTDSIKIEITLKEKRSAGVQEVIIK